MSTRVKSGQQSRTLLAKSNSQEPAIESMRSLRTALSFVMFDAPNNRLLLTGPTPGVGKSFVAANLASVLCCPGKRVLLIDADMRRGHLHQYFGSIRGKGLSELLLAHASPENVIQRDVFPGLDLITTGSIAPEASELLSSDSMGRLLDVLGEGYDLVIIDTPPVLAVSDPGIIATHAGSVFMIARFEQTTIGELNEGARRLQRANTTVKGVILNGVEPRGLGYRSKYGAYRYAAYQYQADELPVR